MFVNIRFRWSHTCNFLKSVCPTNLEFHKLQSMLLNVLWEITYFLKGIHALYSWLKTYRVLKRFSLVKMEKLPQNLFKFQIKVNLSHRWQSKKLISKLMIISTGMWKMFSILPLYKGLLQNRLSIGSQETKLFRHLTLWCWKRATWLSFCTLLSLGSTLWPSVHILLLLGSICDFGEKIGMTGFTETS